MSTQPRMTAAQYRAATTRPRAPRKAPRHLEAHEQMLVVRWARCEAERSPLSFPDLDLLHCSLNGVPMTEQQAKRAKGQGMRAGIPDLFLPVPLHGRAGLYIEMKAGKGRLTTEQRETLPRLARLGYKVATCYGHEQAIAEIRSYYRGEHGAQPHAD